MDYKMLSSLFYSDKEQFEKTLQRRLSSESTYKFDFKIKSHDAFVVLNNEILKRIEIIHDLDKLLLNNMNSVPPIALDQYRKKCLIDEIRMTNEIEGVHSTRREINEILNNNKNLNKRLFGLVKKYQFLEDEEIKLETCEDIRNLYNELVLKEVEDEDKNNIPDGKIFRKGTVFVQNEIGKKIHDGIYPEEEIISHMNSALNILNNKELNFLIRIAVFHYLIGYIHPFYDGNGRISRFISSYLLSNKFEDLLSYRLSCSIKQNINSYYKSFKETNDEKNRGDLTIFVIKFLNILIKSLQELNKSLIQKNEKLVYFSSEAEKIFKYDSNEFDIIFILIQNSLFGDNGLSVEDLSIISHLGSSTVRKTLKKLETIDSLLEIYKDGRKKIYCLNLDYLELNVNKK